MSGRGCWLVIGAGMLLATAWCALAIYFSDLPGRSGAAGAYSLAVVAALLFARNRQRAVGWSVASFAAVGFWWATIQPSNERAWIPFQARLPRAEIEGTRVTLHDVRDFEYRSASDFTSRYVSRTVDLEELETLDLVLCYWDGNRAVAHTMLSFGFAGGTYLVASAEMRREQGEAQTGLRGLFKQYELALLIGTEQDLLGLRTHHVGEEVFLYPTRSTREQVRSVFLDVLDRVEQLNEQPEFYNTLTHNCTTSLVSAVQKVVEQKLHWYELVRNGFTDRLAHARGWIDTDLSFEEAREFFHVNRAVRDHPLDAAYSRRLRPYLPPD